MPGRYADPWFSKSGRLWSLNRRWWLELDFDSWQSFRGRSGRVCNASPEVLTSLIGPLEGRLRAKSRGVQLFQGHGGLAPTIAPLLFDCPYHRMAYNLGHWRPSGSSSIRTRPRYLQGALKKMASRTRLRVTGGRLPP